MEVKKGYKQTGIGVIPEDWKVRKIGDFTTSYAGGTPSTKESSYWGGNIKWMNSGELNYKFIFDVTNRITDEGLNNSSTKLIPEKCVLIGLAGQGKTRGTVAINYTKLCTNQSIASIYPSSNHNSEFLYYFIDNLYDELRSLSTGDGGRGGLNLTIIRNLDIPLPPLPEQQAIAEVLSDTDELIQSLKTLIAKKEAIKQGAMQELLTGKKRLPGFTEEWETKKLGEMLSYEQPPKYIINSDILTKGKTPVLTANKSFVLGYTNENFGIYTNTPVVIFDDFTTLNKYVDFDFKIKSSAIKLLRNKQNHSLKFLYNRMQLIEHPLGDHKRYYISEYKNIEIKVPNLKEQQAIAQILSDMDAEIEALKQQLQKTQILKEGMMQELLTGKIRLVKPVTQHETEPLAMVAKPEGKYKSNEGHNWEFNEAIIISAMVDKFGSEKYPLGRKRYTKLCYLMHRYKEEEVKGYLKKTAGPYNPATKYKGPEKIAQKNKYIKKKIVGKYAGFVVDECILKANAYFKKWYGENVLNWLEQFRFQSNDTLELWATVDMAIEDLKEENKPANIQTIKELINNHKEWRPKLKRPIFSDDNIRTAINKLNQLFG